MSKFHLSMVYEALSKCSPCEHSRVVGGKLVCTAPTSAGEVQLFNADYTCPLGRWKSRVGTPIVSVKIPEQNSPQADARQEQRTTWTKAAEFLRSMGSLVTGLVDRSVYEKRQDSCASCPKKLQRGDRAYCVACDCGVWFGAELDNKLWVPTLPCPLKRPGFSNAEVERE